MTDLNSLTIGGLIQMHLDGTYPEPEKVKVEPVNHVHVPFGHIDMDSTVPPLDPDTCSMLSLDQSYRRDYEAWHARHRR